MLSLTLSATDRYAILFLAERCFFKKMDSCKLPIVIIRLHDYIIVIGWLRKPTAIGKSLLLDYRLLLPCAIMDLIRIS
jgi:hypothetical protein